MQRDLKCRPVVHAETTCNQNRTQMPSSELCTACFRYASLTVKAALSRPQSFVRTPPVVRAAGGRLGTGQDNHQKSSHSFKKHRSDLHCRESPRNQVSAPKNGRFSPHCASLDPRVGTRNSLIELRPWKPSPHITHVIYHHWND